MRRAGSARRIIAPGVRAAVGDYLSRLDATFCLGPRCSRCAFLAALTAGDRVAVSGELVWRAMFDPRQPGAWDRFLGDDRLYALVGADWLEVVDG